MLKILEDRLQQYMNLELPDVQTGFRKGIQTRDQIANICCIIEKARGLKKKNLLTDYAKAFVWKILKEMGIPDYLTCLLKNLYAGRTRSNG